jgi:uncharacterized membrane protein
MAETELAPIDGPGGGPGPRVVDTAVAEPGDNGLERLVFFSDGVFAIAITLLALDIRLPGAEGSLTDQVLLERLIAIGPKYLAYVLSFLVIGIFWVSHHRRFRYFERTDNGLMLLNLFLLMGIAFMPFPTAIISSNGNQTATVFYALTVSAISLLSTLIWAYATRQHRLVPAALSGAIIRQEQVRGLVMVAIFVLSTGLAAINADLAKLSWTLLFPAWLAVHG